MKNIICILVSVMLVFSVLALSGCSDTSTTSKDNGIQTDDKNDENNNNNEKNDDLSDLKNPVATIDVENYGVITVELYPEKAPNTVKNFIHLANSKFYDGLTFHRIIENFMIQGGCPEGTGMGDPGYSIKGEFSYNGFADNDIVHDRGVISMARGGYSMDSAGSQFFIMHKKAPHLDGQYAAFGMVIEGIEVVDKIAVVSTDSNDKPTTPVVINSIRVNTFGSNYDEPLTIK